MPRLVAAGGTAYDAGMDQQAKRAVKPFGLPSGLLLVLAVLTGLVAMHGLGPGAVPAASHTAATAHRAPAGGHDAAAGAAAPAGHDGCAHAGDPADGGSGGHAQHADATCAAAGTAGSPVLPVPALLPVALGAQAVIAHGILPDAAACGRAPPSLSELQLLRI